jgi:DNA-binding transcriptional MerR regulator
MIRYSIKDLEKITGIKAHTIRIWEKRYRIVEPLRTVTNIRYYSDADLRRLMNVAILNKYGYKISNIQSMSSSEINECVIGLTNQYLDNEHQVDNLVMAMIELDENRFDKIITSSIIKFGFDYTFEELLQKFLDKIGILWQIGSIYPVQEHFISQLVRQKLILAIDAQQSLKEANKTFLLFLPEGEYHELALLYLHLQIRKAGHRVIYLGQNVPVLHLREVFIKHKIDFLVTSITSRLAEEELLHLFETLRTLYPSTPILAGGNGIENSKIAGNSKVELFEDVNEFNSLVSNL